MRLFSKGISFGFEDCGKAGTWSAATNMMAIAHCEAALKGKPPLAVVAGAYELCYDLAD